MNNRMTEKHFSQMLDLWKKCDNQGITRSEMFHMSEIIQASRNPEYVIEVYKEYGTENFVVFERLWFPSAH